MRGLLSRITGKQGDIAASGYSIGNAQSIGKMEFQSNYFATTLSPNLFAVMADGGVDHINGRKAAVIAVESMLEAFSGDKIVNEHYFIEVINETALKIIRRIKDSVYGGKTPGLSLAAVCLSGGGAYFFTLGNIRVFVYDDKKIKDIHSLSRSNFYAGVKPSDSFALFSGGVGESLNQIEIYRHLLKKDRKYGYSDESSQNKAVKIIDEVNKKNLRNAKNATVVLLEGKL